MRVYLETTGCRLNQSEIEAMARQFHRAGHTIVHAPEQADLCVVNTCAVTRAATRSSRSLVRGLHRANPDARIVATGCYAHLSPGTVASLPGVEQVMSNANKDQLVPLVLGLPEGGTPYEQEPLARDTAPSALGRTRAFVKVQDGCNNRCTFCVTTIARGPGRSRALDDVVREIRALAAAGYQEAVLTGVHLGSYGHDRRERSGLETLVRAVLDETPMRRLRLSSLEPWDLDPEFFALWENPQLCRHLHLPLQSGCDATLKRMGRRTSQQAFQTLVGAARAAIPDLAISTDIIVGFPGETENEFEQSFAFVQQVEFMKLHVFRYSARPGTAAASMPGRVPDDVMKARSERLRELSDDGARRFWAGLVGRECEVLWEQVSGVSEAGFDNSGLTDHYVRVELTAPRVLTNTIDCVHITGVTESGVRGALVARDGAAD